MTLKKRRGFTFIELMVTMFIGVLLLGAVVVFAAVQTEDQKRQKCASNLKQIGLALLLYSNENRGGFPRTRFDPKVEKVKAYTNSEAKDPFEKDGPEANDVTAALFLLLRTQDILRDVFVCPSTDDVSPASSSNFVEKKNLSYSYANPYPNAAAIKAGYKLNNSVDQAFVLAGDKNPGGDALLKLTPKSTVDEMRAGNSANHGQEGQNLLFGDGHVEFVKIPFAGIKHDNIYTYGPSGDDVDKGGEGINGSPIGPGDSILLPSADMTGPADAEKL